MRQRLSTDTGAVCVLHPCHIAPWHLLRHCESSIVMHSRLVRDGPPEWPTLARRNTAHVDRYTHTDVSHVILASSALCDRLLGAPAQVFSMVSPQGVFGCWGGWTGGGGMLNVVPRIPCAFPCRAAANASLSLSLQHACVRADLCWRTSRGAYIHTAAVTYICIYMHTYMHTCLPHRSCVLPVTAPHCSSAASAPATSLCSSSTSTRPHLCCC